MNDILNKISSYNIINNLLPGILFVILLKYFVGYDLLQKEILLSLFLYYFIGMTIGRISSIIFEPLLKKMRFVKFIEYNLYVDACKKDEKINILVESNNLYRVIFTLLITLVLTKLYDFLQKKLLFFSENTENYLLLILLSTIYLYSYRKQTNYIKKRVNANN